MRQKQRRHHVATDDPLSPSTSPSSSSTSSTTTTTTTTTAFSGSGISAASAAAAAVADSTSELSLVVGTRSSAAPAQPTFHLPFHEVPFSLPAVTLDDPTAAASRRGFAAASLRPSRQPTVRAGSAPSSSESTTLSQFDVAARVYNPEGSNAGADSAEGGGAHYLVLQQQWEEEQRQVRRQLDPNVQKQQRKAQKQQEQRQRRVTEGVAAVLCALPNNAGTGLDDPVADKYRTASSPHGRRMKDLAEARRLRNAVGLVGNDRAKSKLIQKLTMVPTDAGNNGQDEPNDQGGDLQKPRDTIKLLEQWKEDLQDMLQPKPKMLQSISSPANSASPKSLRTRKKESKLLPVVDLRTATLAREQEQGDQAPSMGRGSGPRSRRKSREDRGRGGAGGAGSTPGPHLIPQDHVYAFLRDLCRCALHVLCVRCVMLCAWRLPQVRVLWRSGR